MGLSVVNYVENATGNANWGLLQFECISPLKTRYPSHRELMARYFSSPEEFASDTENRTLSTEEVSFLSPISEDVQLFCQGLNYADHRVESGMSNAVSSENLVFMKAGSSICGPNDTILRPKDCKLLDYEIELGLVMREGLDHAIDVGEFRLAPLRGGNRARQRCLGPRHYVRVTDAAMVSGQEPPHLLPYGACALPHGRRGL